MTVLDSLILELDKALRTVFALTSAFRAVLSEQSKESPLFECDRAHAGAMMRVIHVGGICAQALYQGRCR